MEVYDEYDLLLFLFFKDMYGVENKDGSYELHEDVFRRMWLDYLNYYSKRLSERYAYIASYSNYTGPYTSCPGMIQQIANTLCSSDSRSLCRVSDASSYTHDDIKEILEVLNDLYNLYDQEVMSGCEGEIYM